VASFTCRREGSDLEEKSRPLKSVRSRHVLRKTSAREVTGERLCQSVMVKKRKGKGTNKDVVSHV